MNLNSTYKSPEASKSKAKNILIRTLLIAAIISVLVLFFVLFDYSAQNDGAEIFQSLKNGG